MEQAQPGLVRCQVHRDSTVGRHHNSVLHDTARGLAVDVDQLKEMTVQVHWMRVVGAIAEHQPVALPFLQDELPVVWVGLAVDRPQVELPGGAGNLLEHHVDRVRGCGGRCGDGFAERGVVPVNSGLRNPLRFSMLVRVFDHDAEACVAGHVVG